MDRECELADIILALNENSECTPLSEHKRSLLASADYCELAHAQQRALQAGMELEDLFNIWQQNKRVLPDQVAKMRTELPDSHIIQLILAEHDMIFYFAADLNIVNDHIQKLDYAASTNACIRKLEHITGHLAAASQHPEREDQIIFPQLRQKGFPGPSEIITLQHQQLFLRLEELQQLVWAVDDISFDTFKLRLQQLVEYIVPVMKRHIFIENNLILPFALEIIDEPHIWEKIKQICDEIGYCGYDAR